jgi:hypothetical protein
LLRRLAAPIVGACFWCRGSLVFFFDAAHVERLSRKGWIGVNLFFFGHIGSDAGGWWIGPDGVIHVVPGWNPEAVQELQRAVDIVRLAGQLQTKGLGQRVIESVLPFVQEQLGAQVSGGGVAFGG